MATMGGSSVVTELARNFSTIHCCNAYSVRLAFARTCAAAGQACKVLVQLVEAGINQVLARQPIKRAGLDAMHQLPRNAAAGNQIKPAARRPAGAVHS